MEKRTLLAVVLAIIVVMVWQTLFMPHPPPQTTNPQSQVTQESPGEEVSVADNLPATPKDGGLPEDTSATSPSNYEEPSDLPLEEKTVTGERFVAVFTTEGGGIKHWQLLNYTTYQRGEGPLDVARNIYKSKPVLRENNELMDLLKGSQSNAVPFSIRPDVSPDKRYRLVSSSDSKIRFERREGNILISKTYSLPADQYLVGLNISLKNLDDVETVVVPSLALRGETPLKKGRSFAPIAAPIYYLDGEVERVKVGDLEEAPVAASGNLGWVGINDKYFLRSLLPPKETRGTVVISDEGEGARDESGGEKASDPLRIVSVGISSGEVKIAPHSTYELNYQIFLGPKRSELLESYNRDLDKSLDFGMFGVFAEPILWLLKHLYTGVGSYGLAIILLTLIIKTLFYPLMVKQLQSAQKMKEFQPQMAELREKYKDDKNQLNQEMMRFMQEKKMNPLGGCLPVLLQMPIWFALYRVLQNSVELYHTPFIYLPDLSEKDPFGISPLVLGVLMFVQQKITPTAPGMDSTQAKMMQYLPLIFAAIMFTLPSGLVVYILVNTVLTILQQWIITWRSQRNSTKQQA